MRFPIAALLAACLASRAGATTIASWSSSYTVLSTQPVPEAYASFRFSLGSTPLLTAHGLTGGTVGLNLILPNDGSILAALSNGVDDLMLLEMNLDPQFDAGAAGGGMGFFDSDFAAAYLSSPQFGEPVNALILRVDRLLFEPVNAKLGFGTQATLDFTFLVTGAPALAFTPASMAASAVVPSLNLVAQPVPEPAAWVGLTIGLALIWLGGRR